MVVRHSWVKVMLEVVGHMVRGEEKSRERILRNDRSRVAKWVTMVWYGGVLEHTTNPQDDLVNGQQRHNPQKKEMRETARPGQSENAREPERAPRRCR
jgi:hypothetical protein